MAELKGEFKVHWPIPTSEQRQQWERVTFDFKGYGSVNGNLRTTIKIAGNIYSILPIKTEGLVLDGVEILIKIPPVLKERLKTSERTHEAMEGDIIYRPQIPALSLFSDYFEIYEPVAKIGMIDRNDIPKLRKIVEEATSLMLVEVKKLEI